MSVINPCNDNEHLRRLNVTARFTEAFNDSNNLHTCTVCACKVNKQNRAVVGLEFLTNCGTLAPLPESKTGALELTQGMMLARQGLLDVAGIPSAKVCVECLEQLHRNLVPMLALNGPYHICDVPDTLQELGFLEKLLVTLCFPVQYMVKIRNATEGQSAIRLSELPRKTTWNPPSVPIKAVDLQRILHLESSLASGNIALLQPTFRVRRTIIENAINWLCGHNHHYATMTIDMHELAKIPMDGVPDWVLQRITAAKDDPCPVEKTIDTYAQFPSITIDTFPKAFPHLFPDGYIPFDLSIRGQARLMGKWAVNHGSDRFDNQIAFYHLLLETCQRDDIAATVDMLPEQLEGACWDVQVNYMKTLLATVLGGDSDRTALRGEAAGITLRLGQPNFIIALEPDGRTVSQFHDSANHGPYLGGVIKAHREISMQNSPREAAHSFNRLVRTFISEILYGKDGQGLFGETLAFLGRVEHREGNALGLEILLWVGGDERPSSIGSDAAAIYRRGANTLCTWSSCTNLLGNDRISSSSHLCSFNATNETESAIERTLRYNFHHTSSGSRNAETSLAMTSINEFKEMTRREKIAAAVRGMIREEKWSETEMVRLLSSEAAYYRSHRFTTVDVEGIRGKLISTKDRLWGESPQVLAYTKRDAGFRDWNFVEFTLAAAEGTDHGLRHAVDKHTLMPRLAGRMPTAEETGPEAMALKLGLMKPWRSRADLLGYQATWVAAWDAFENTSLNTGFLIE